MFERVRAFDGRRPDVRRRGGLDDEGRAAARPRPLRRRPRVLGVDGDRLDIRRRRVGLER